MSGIPEEWRQLLQEHRVAQINHDVMRASGVGQAQRDVAAVRYGRSCDHMMDLLDIMSERLVLGRITQLLARDAVNLARGLSK